MFIHNDLKVNTKVIVTTVTPPTTEIAAQDPFNIHSVENDAITNGVAKFDETTASVA